MRMNNDHEAYKTLTFACITPAKIQPKFAQYLKILRPTMALCGPIIQVLMQEKIERRITTLAFFHHKTNKIFIADEPLVTISERYKEDR